MRKVLQAVAALFLLAVAVPGIARAELPAVDQMLSERVLGDPKAPVTIIEYASLTCPHCADFQAHVLPEIKKAYIDTGKVKLINRDFPLDGVALRAAMLTRCVAPDRYHSLVDVLFKTQDQWATSADPVKSLAQLGVLAGLSPADADACLKDQALMDGILKARQAAADQAKVEATPTFVFNGGSERIEGAQSFDQFKAVIDKLLSKS